MTGSNLTNVNAQHITPWFTLGTLKTVEKTLEGFKALPVIDLYNSKSAFNNTLFLTSYTKAAVNENAIYSPDQVDNSATDDPASTVLDSIKLAIWNGNTATSKSEDAAIVKVEKIDGQLTFSISKAEDATDAKDYINFNVWKNNAKTTNIVNVKVVLSSTDVYTLYLSNPSETETDAAYDQIDFAVFVDGVKTVDSTTVKAVDNGGLVTLSILSASDFELYRMMEIQMHDDTGVLKCYPRWVKDRSLSIEDGKITRIDNLIATYYKLVPLNADDKHIVNVAYYDEVRPIAENHVRGEYGYNRDIITAEYYVNPSADTVILPSK